MRADTALIIFFEKYGLLSLSKYFQILYSYTHSNMNRLSSKRKFKMAVN